MNTNQKRRQQPKTPSYKYSFRLNEEQNIRRYPASDRSVGAADPRAEGFKYRDSELRKTGEGVVANIRSGSSPGGALYYNKEKVDKDEA